MVIQRLHYNMYQVVTLIRTETPTHYSAPTEISKTFIKSRGGFVMVEFQETRHTSCAVVCPKRKWLIRHAAALHCAFKPHNLTKAIKKYLGRNSLPAPGDSTSHELVHVSYNSGGLGLFFMQGTGNIVSDGNLKCLSIFFMEVNSWLLLVLHITLARKILPSSYDIIFPITLSEQFSYT